MATHSQLKPNQQYVIFRVEIEFASDTEKTHPIKAERYGFRTQLWSPRRHV